MRVGPRSAGADPGPICYGNGGTEPTVTDANVVMGIINPDYFLGGERRLDAEAARDGIARLAAGLGLSLENTAAGICRIVDTRMAGEIRRLTLFRGYDPRDFVVFAFGGGGPTHAAVYAPELGVKQVIVPLRNTAAVWSALGAFVGGVVHLYERNLYLREPLDIGALNAAFTEMEREAEKRLRAQGFDSTSILMERTIAIKYCAQVSHLEITVPNGKLDLEKPASLRDTEKRLQEELERAKAEWEEESKHKRYPIDEENIAEVVCMMTGIPVKRMVQAESEKLRNMAVDMSGMVVGQSEAIQKVVKAIQRNRVGLKDPKKPVGTFIFLGPTGVGKTELARSLARYMFDSEDALIRIDMSEYMEKFTVSRLIGAPPGYVGYEEGGQLTEKVRRKPYSVILLDEIEKAHPDIYNILLQVLDDGQLTDGLGRRIDFKNTLIIMTSNIGARQLKDFGDGVGFATAARTQNTDENNKAVIEKALKRTFSPEFLNRIDDVVIFNSLSKENIFEIIDILMKGVLKRLTTLGFTLELTDEAKNFIADKGYDQQFGARPLHRAIQKYLEDPLAEEILSMNIKNGDVLIAELDKEHSKIRFTLKEREAQRSEA